MQGEKIYKVKIEVDQLDGGIPANKDPIGGWLNANGIQDDEELAQAIADGVIKEEDLEENLEKLTTTFMINDLGEPCIEARCIKAALKQAAGVMGVYGAVPGLKELLKEGTEIHPKLIPVATSVEELKTAVRVMHTDNKGTPVSAFKRVRYIDDAVMEFHWHITDRQAIVDAFMKYKPPKPTKKKAEAEVDEKPKKDARPKVRKGARTIDIDQARMILEYACQFTGFGANRSQRSGKGELLILEEVTD